MEEADRALLESILVVQILLLAHEMRKERGRMDTRGSTEFVDEAAQLVRKKRAQIVEVTGIRP